MLVSIMANLMLESGIIPPPAPTPTPSDNTMFFNQGGASAEFLKDRQKESKKNIFNQDEEDLLFLINNIIVSQNLN